jgi:hypothetical protein
MGLLHLCDPLEEYPVRPADPPPQPPDWGAPLLMAETTVTITMAYRM